MGPVLVLGRPEPDTILLLYFVLLCSPDVWGLSAFLAVQKAPPQLCPLAQPGSLSDAVLAHHWAGEALMGAVHYQFLPLHSGRAYVTKTILFKNLFLSGCLQPQNPVLIS